MENKTILIENKQVQELEEYNEEFQANKILKKIHYLLYNEKYERVFKLLNEGIEEFKDFPSILAKFEIMKVTALLRIKRFDHLDEMILSLQEKYKYDRENLFTLESLMQEFFIRTKNFSAVIKNTESLKEKYPENISLLEVQRLNAYLQSGREEIVISKALELAKKYPERETTFIILRFKALMQLGRYEEIYSLNPEDVKQRENRNDVIKFGRFKVEALARKGMIKEALEEMNSLRFVYQVKKSYFKEQINLIHEKEEEMTGFSQLIEMNEEDFMNYAKGLNIMQFTFLQVARYKYEKRHKIALETIEEYKRRCKENTDLDFTKKLKELAVIKKKSFDYMKWYKLSKKLDLFPNINNKDLKDKDNQFDLAI